jgi:hypothetical protein
VLIPKGAKASLATKYLPTMQNPRLTPDILQMHSFQLLDSWLQTAIVRSSLHHHASQTQEPDVRILSGTVEVTVANFINVKTTRHGQEY